jgi:hypothetical protein
LISVWLLFLVVAGVLPLVRVFLVLPALRGLKESLGRLARREFRVSLV